MIVYFLCQNCNEITESEACFDRIVHLVCQKCKTKSAATWAGFYRKIEDKEEKRLYVKDGFLNPPSSWAH